MRGESRLCKGSIEPLLKLPDGALATRRIVLFRCVAAAAARCASVRLKRRAAQQLCRRASGGARARTFCIATRMSDVEMIFDRQQSPVATAIDVNLDYAATACLLVSYVR